MQMEPDLERATRHASAVLGAWAPEIDRTGRHPFESVAAMHNAGLLGLLVPEGLGGLGADYRTVFDVASILGEQCLSSAMIFAMHCSQVAVLRERADGYVISVLEDVVRRGRLIASVTSEPGTPGDVLSAYTPLVRRGATVEIRRSAPYASYAADAGYFFVKMRRSAEAAATDVAYVLIARENARLRVCGDWEGPGLRGTRTVPIELEAELPDSHVLHDGIPLLTLGCMLPVAHLGWVGAWHGAAWRALREVVAHLRTAGSRAQQAVLNSDRLKSELALVRMRLAGVRARACVLASRLDCRALTNDDISATHRVEVNELKLAGSVDCLWAVERLVELVGLRDAYLTTSRLGLERVLRDLRLAPLMYANEYLLRANGSLTIAEMASLERLSN